MAHLGSRILSVAARVALAAVFVDGGRHVWSAPAGPARGAGRLLGRVRGVVPALDAASDEQLVRANAAVHIGAGVALALGVAPRHAAAALVASLVPTTLAVFSFWDLSVGPDRDHAQAAFLKNLAVAGGLVGILGSPRS